MLKKSISSLKLVTDSIFKKNINSYCFIESAIADTPIIVAADGSLLSIVRIDGVKKMIGEHEMGSVINDMTIKLSSYFDSTGHAMQVWFSRDPDGSKELIKNLNRPARRVASDLQLDLDDLFAEREEYLSKHIVQEGSYIALWTRPSVLSKNELENFKKDTKLPDVWPRAIDAQNFFKASETMRTRHESFINSFVSDLKQTNIRCGLIESHKAINAIRSSLYPNLAGGNWQPVLAGDFIFPQQPNNGDKDYSHLFAPRLQDQLFPSGAEVLSPRMIRLGRYNFASLDMSIGPQEIKQFSDLLQRIIMTGEFPWRVSFLVEGNGLSGSMGLKGTLAAILSFTNNDNKQISDAIKGLRQIKDQEGEIIVRYRVSFSTWAPSDNIRELEERVSQLQRSIESWGYCSVTGSSGDPVAANFSSSLGIDIASTAPAGAPPLRDALYMMPWNRDASPWLRGSVLFRTPDGRPWQYEPGSSLQSTFIDLIFAPPGYAKSVFLNTTNLALCLSPTATQSSAGAKLPRIAIIDVGPSSSGLISLIKESLPTERRHEAQYKRLRMIKEHAINPFDTQLGCRKPMPLERAFLVNFLSIVGTAVGERKPPSGLSDLAGMVVDELFEEFSDTSRKGNPRLYTYGEDKDVDEAIKRHDIHLDLEPSWWSVVDALYDKGDKHNASLAQRHAVPRLEDLSSIVRKQQIMDVYGGAKTETGETLIEVFQRMVSSGLREYPILTLPTKFDIGESRVVSLDIDEAAPRGGGPADKQTSIVYMLARFVLARDFYLNEEVLTFIPEKYKEHHQVRIKNLRETPKKIVLDEFHRTKSSDMVREQVMIDLREGRKWGVHVALASQLIDDFDDAMVDVATGVWIMGAGTERAAKKTAEIFGLSDAAYRVVRHELNGPGPKGAPFLALLNLKDGKHEHLLVNTLGPMELWSFSTTAEDAALRNRLYQEIGPSETRRRLAKRFPSGSAKNEIERRIAQMAESGKSSKDSGSGIIEDIVNEIKNLE